MTEIRVQQEELDFTDYFRAFRNNEPFTGVVYDLTQDGNLWSEMSYVDGWQHGITKEWSLSGTLIVEEAWQSGYLHGLLQEWFEDGNLKRQAEFELGTRVSDKRWNQEGRLVESFEISEKDADYRFLMSKRKHFGEKKNKDLDT
ncbi:MAG: hypothetical protein AAFV98_03505 [Chloroflexota bacterium]